MKSVIKKNNVHYKLKVHTVTRILCKITKSFFTDNQSLLIKNQSILIWTVYNVGLPVPYFFELSKNISHIHVADESQAFFF